MANVELTNKSDLSTFRRIAIGTWKNASDAQVYGTLEMRMEKTVAYLEAWRKATGKRLTITHLVARAAAAAMRDLPDANAMLRFSRVYLRKNVDVFLQVVLPNEDSGKVDLTGVTIRDADKKSLEQISDETERRIRAARRGEDKELEKTRSSFRLIPLAVVGLFLRIIGFLTYTLNLRLPGMPRDPFGSLMITNVGSLGIDTAYVTFDHRFIDGFHAAVMSRTLTAWFSNPEKHFGAIPTELTAPEVQVARTEGRASRPPQEFLASA
jgi:pyruvate/2-oxoglutarate dehydrogenase complex dihydrolipoamide acyltransferase (E2) component